MGRHRCVAAESDRVSREKEREKGIEGGGRERARGTEREKQTKQCAEGTVSRAPSEATSESETESWLMDM